jgi:hypothetical protein
MARPFHFARELRRGKLGFCGGPGPGFSLVGLLFGQPGGNFA